MMPHHLMMLLLEGLHRRDRCVIVAVIMPMAASWRAVITTGRRRTSSPATTGATATSASAAATSATTGAATHRGAREPLDGGSGVGLQRAVVQLVVEPALEDRALRGIEIGAELLVVLDLRDQRRAGLFLTAGDRRQMRIDGVGFGQERGPEIGLN